MATHITHRHEPPARRLAIAVALALAAATLQAGNRTVDNPEKEARMPVTATAIPESIRVEHRAIHEQLEEAMQAPGQVGEAARTLGKVLHPHFVREEEIALPPLGALVQLAAGTLPSDATALLTMTDTLKRELPGMLAEHTRIRGAVRELREAARVEQAAKYERLAEQLALHAQTEEEVLYPAAVLVGDVIRARMAAR
jgi:iron-sulfur cluster repair protein YtfE (RIC family)